MVVAEQVEGPGPPGLGLTPAAGDRLRLVRTSQPAGEVVPTHTHPFAVHALVTQGEMWLTQGGCTLHLKPGDTFTLAREEPHDELYGPQGAIDWAARRHAA